MKMWKIIRGIMEIMVVIGGIIALLMFILAGAVELYQQQAVWWLWLVIISITGYCILKSYGKQR